MKTILTIYCAFMLTIAAYAQEPDKALVKVQYNFIHIADTTQRDRPYTETMLLIAGKNASLYTSYDRIDRAVNQWMKIQEMRKNGFAGGFIPAPAYTKPVSQTQYYFFAKEHKFFRMEYFISAYLVEDEIEKPNWKIAKDTLSFSGIHCQKATARFKGRNWIAWFAAELPFESGPWKLNGLPGLIIEAYDDKKEVQFMFDGIEKIKEGDLATDNAHTIAADKISTIAGLDISHVAFPPERPVMQGGYQKITEKEFDKLQAANDKDPDAFRIAQFAAIGITNPPPAGSGGGGGSSGGGKSQTATITRAPAPPPLKVVINNPIELQEKK